jgi:hypothetical protein
MANIPAFNHGDIETAQRQIVSGGGSGESSPDDNCMWFAHDNPLQVNALRND